MITFDEWVTSTRSQGNNNCVEVAKKSGWVAVRDSKDRDGGLLIVAGDAWTSFLSALKHDERS
jgi:hypothetical protein